MREDMAKVIVERPRGGGGGLRYPRARLRDWTPIEESPRRQSIRRPWDECGYRKGLNENLAPLRRYLLSNVGRPWDKVFSEMSRHMRLDSAVQLHIWQHVQWEVCFDAVRVGRDYVDSRGLPVRARFLVDARTGLLRRNEEYGRRWWRGPYYVWRPPPSPYEEVIEVDETHQHWKISGIWYLVTLAPLPKERAGIWDVVRRKPGYQIERNDIIFRGRQPFYCAAKRQLNSKEIRRLPRENA
jgi:hypothetical protein